jgi:hypothetical protein
VRHEPGQIAITTGLQSSTISYTYLKCSLPAEIAVCRRQDGGEDGCGDCSVFFQLISPTIFHNNEVPINVKAAALKIQVKK